MITQPAYDALKSEQQEGESYSQVILKLVSELNSYRKQHEENINIPSITSPVLSRTNLIDQLECCSLFDILDPQ